MKYVFISKKGKGIEGVTIDESAKEDVKKLMGWDELDWRTNTAIIVDKLREGKSAPKVQS